MNKIIKFASRSSCGRLFCRGLAVFAAMAMLIPAAAQAQNVTGGGLAVAPTRLVIESNERGADLILRNRAAQPATYRISLTGGEPGPGGYAADDMIRFSPRQVTVAGDSNQTVRVAVRRPADLPPGDFTTRIRFEAIPTGQPTQAVTAAGDGISMQLEAIYAVSLPITIRQD